MTENRHNDFSHEYTIERKIGRGGTADIYLATRSDRARPVVLKRFYDPSAESLIAKELEIAKRVRFPGVVRVHGAGETQNKAPHLEMEYCPGPTLESFPGRVTERRLLSIMSAISASLHVLHSAGYIHNDLKPSNIFCPTGFERDDFPIDKLFYLKLTDFSLAEKFTEGEIRNVSGTIGYMSPEMILKKRISPQSDLFSLGVMAWQLACGRMPFESDSDDPLEINAMITEGDRPMLCGPGESFSTPFADLIHSLMEINPDKRPPSAFELMELLAEIGSPYPFRQSIRPRHLLNSRPRIDAAVLDDLFGTGSFSPAQLMFVEQATGFEPASVRILLDHNFDRDNFTRLAGRWGWRNATPDVIEWSDRQVRLSLRPLRGAAPATLKLAMAVAIVGDETLVETVSTIMGTDAGKALDGWKLIPEACRPAIVHSLNKRMRASTRRILAGRMAPLFADDDARHALAGRLFYYAGDYRSAIEHILASVAGETAGEHRRQALRLLDMALDAADKIDDADSAGQILLQRAEIQKEADDLDLAEATLYDVVSLGETTQRDALIAQACKSLGDLYKAKSQYAKGIQILERAREIYTRMDEPLGLSHTLNNLGNMYWVNGQLDEALDHYQQALTIQEELDAEKYIASTLSNIGSIHVVKGEFPQSIDYYNRSLEIKETLGNKEEIARTWNNMGVAFFLQGESTEAIEAYEKSYALNVEIENSLEQLWNLENLAEAKIQAGDLQDALKNIRTGTELSVKINDEPHRCTFAHLTGQLLRRMGSYDAAESKLIEAVEIAEKLDNKSLLLRCYHQYAHLYHDLKDDSRADEKITAAAAMADEIGDLHMQFHTALSQLSFTGEERYSIRAEQHLEKLNTNRERALLNLTRLELEATGTPSQNSAEHLRKAGDYFGDDRKDIDTARYFIAAGRYFRTLDDFEAARDHLQSAAKIAKALNLLPDLWRATCLLSELMFSIREMEGSFTYARQTTAILKKIAADISDSERRGRVHNDPMIIDLLGRIKSLQAVVGKKKGAAEGNP